MVSSDDLLSAYDRHDFPALDRELKKGAAELLLPSVLEPRPWHGWVEKLEGCRRRFDRPIAAGQRVLLQQPRTCDEFVEAGRIVTRGEHA